MSESRYIYDRVVVLGVDGAGNFFKNTATPNMDRIFANGATSYDVLTAIPTISAECWGSMLLGITPEVHRLTNGIVGSVPYDINSIYPSLFRCIRAKYPEAELASFCCWNPINYGIIENNLGVYEDTAGDDELTDKICAYLEHHDPKMLFVQFDWVDGAGHGNGYGTKAHLDRITVTDALIGRIYDMYEKRGFLENTLFIVTADHGGTPGGSHGGTSYAEKIVFWGAAGRTVVPGTIGDMAIRDNAAICLYALGVDQPKTWTARVPSGLFEGVEAAERPVYIEEGAKAPEPTPAPKVIYDRVVVLGVDGAGNFFKDTPTPNMDRIFMKGATNYNVLTAIPTISAECWGSMLLGITPEAHHLTNGVVSSVPYDVNSIFPSLFREIRAKYPDAELASFCCWNPINYGIIENNLGVYEDTAGDDELTDKICAYLEDHDPKMLFVQFDWVDGAGHGHGYGSKEHLDRITATDALIGRIHEMYVKRGFIDNTLFIVTADHGGTPPREGVRGGGHGGTSDAEKIVFWGAAGKTVVPGTIGDMFIRDNAAICLYALGVDQPKTWTARVPSGLFEGVEAVERPVYDIAHRVHIAKGTPEVKVTSLLNPDALVAYMPFDDNDYAAAVGRTTVTAHKKRYFPDGYFGTGIKLDDGYLTLDEYQPGCDSFSVAMWFKTGGILRDPTIFANKDRTSGKLPGMYFSTRATCLRFSIGWGEDDWDFEASLPVDYIDGWFHIILSVDRPNNEVTLYFDFEKIVTKKMHPKIAGFDLTTDLPFTIGQDGTGEHPTQLSATIDEFILVREALTEDIVKKMKHFYLD